LVTDGHAVCLVATQPDRPAGRGRDLRPPPVKLAAERHGLPLAQPERVSDPCFLEAVRQAHPEIAVVVAFGQFLPRAVREFPPLGCINVHASLLPRYRGAAPIHRAVMAGDDETGVTIMRVEGRMDAGPILLQRTCPILPDDDTGILHDRLAALGAEALSDALHLLSVGSGAWIPQDETRVSVAPKLGDADCRLELAGPPTDLVNRIRGLSPTPGAYLVMPDGKRLRIFRAEARPASAPRGVILGVEDAAVVLGTGEGAVALLEVQPEGKRRMTGAEFARGQRLQTGMRCG
jgi:methionyl-tRNA formyltransferase